MDCFMILGRELMLFTSLVQLLQGLISFVVWHNGPLKAEVLTGLNLKKVTGITIAQHCIMDLGLGHWQLGTQGIQFLLIDRL